MTVIVVLVLVLDVATNVIVLRAKGFHPLQALRRKPKPERPPSATTLPW